MAKLYADEDFPFPVVDALRQLDHEVLTVFEANRANQAVPDHEVLAFATEQGRALLTLNRRDFIRLHGEHPQHAGIIVCTHDLNFVALAERIDQAIRSVPELDGRLLRVNRPA